MKKNTYEINNWITTRDIDFNITLKENFTLVTTIKYVSIRSPDFAITERAKKMIRRGKKQPIEIYSKERMSLGVI